VRDAAIFESPNSSGLEALDIGKTRAMTISPQYPSTPLSIAMSAAVPLEIMAIKQRGGPTEEDFAILSSGLANLLAEHGDLLLFGGAPRKIDSRQEPITCAEIFTKTAKAIAVLAFSPGGVDLFNQHFEAQKET